MKMKEKSKKAGLNCIEETKIMASGSHFKYSLMANSWETMETVTKFIFLCSKITADGACSHEIKRHVLLGRKARTHCVLKSRDITLLTKVCIDKAMVFTTVVCGCESWTTKMAESQRKDAFRRLCLSRLLSVPWTSSRSDQSILKEINPEYSLEGQMLKLHYFGQLM